MRSIFSTHREDVRKLKHLAHWGNTQAQAAIVKIREAIERCTDDNLPDAIEDILTEYQDLL